MTAFTKLFYYFSKNKSRTLDCWKEVVDFKQAVIEEQKKFVATHQK
jgi:altered-inheritance-of-mitochondria protein 13